MASPAVYVPHPETPAGFPPGTVPHPSTGQPAFPVPMPDGNVAYLTEEEILANQAAYEAYVADQQRRRDENKAIAVGAAAGLALCCLCTIQ